MSNERDFVIENGVLTEYTGNGGDVVIPDGVTGIGKMAFYWCSRLTSITIPDSVTGIGEMAFYRCSRLTSITIPNSVTSIGDDAFYCCGSLTSITIPDSVTRIGDSAFRECSRLKSISSLTSIVIPSSVTSIDESAFERCKLKDVIVSEATIKKIGKAKAQSFFNTSGSLYPYLKGEFIPSCEAIRKLIISDVSRKDEWERITSISLWSDDAPLLAKFLDLRKKVSIEEVEELIERCSKREGSTTVQAFLIDYLQKKFTLEQIQENENVRVEKELGLRDKTLADWRKEFTISFEQNAAVIGTYKGSKETVYVPAKVGPHFVIAIRDKAFAHSTVHTVYISEGIEILGRKMFYGSSAIKDVYIPASVTSIEKDCMKGIIGTIRIHAPAGSYAEKYAKRKKIAFISLQNEESCI